MKRRVKMNASALIKVSPVVVSLFPDMPTKCLENTKQSTLRQPFAGTVLPFPRSFDTFRKDSPVVASKVWA